MLMRLSTTLPRFKLCRLQPHFIPEPVPLLQSAITQFTETPLRRNPFSTAPDRRTESPELPGWLKLSETRGSFYADSDADFEIPEVSDWAQYQKSCNQAKDVVKSDVVDRVEREADEVSKVLKCRFQSPDDAAEALNDKCAAISVSEDLVLKLLNRFGNDFVGAVGVFKWAKMQSRFEIPATLYNQMVDILGKCKKFELMWELVDEMNQLSKGFVTLNTMTKVIRRLTRAGKFSQAIQAFGSMEKLGVKRDIQSMNVLLDSLVKEGSVEIASVVFLDLKNEIQPTAHTFNILIHGWCKARKVDEAYKVLEEMEACGLSPDTVTYTSFIEAYCRDKDFRKVEETLTEMREKGCRPNVITYTIYAHALGKSKQIKQAFEVYERMKIDGCIPDASFYSSLIFQLGKSGRLDDAIDLYKDMLKHDVTPNLITYSSLITMYCQHSREGDALKLLLEMENKSVKPDVKTYDPLLKMSCRKKQMKVLAFLLNNMFKNDVSPEFATYTLLVNELCKIEKLEQACLFFEEMILVGFTPKKSTHELLMKLLEKKNMGKAMEQISVLYSSIKEKASIQPMESESPSSEM
uniref:Pentatricopeptide repeat-containing protein n=1 Tax=Kalanchoe fedtschenkoi TaxID=63787 RepID=A0A7N0UT48_KALFE